MKYDFLMQIPLIVPILTLVNIGVLKITELNGDFPLKDELSQLVRWQFIAKTPIYFNYWIIYIAIAIIFSVIFLVTKKYTPCRTGMVVILNIIVGIMTMRFIVANM